MKQFMVVVCVLVFSALVLSACQSVPPELAAANTIQDEAAKRVDEGRRVVILAYDRELRAAYDEQLRLITHIELLKLQSTGQLTLDAVEALRAKEDARRKEIAVTLDQKRDEFLTDKNLDILIRLNQAEGRWIRAVDEAARNLDEIINTGKTVIGGK